MKADLLEAIVRGMRRRGPFRTFLIELQSGDRVAVSHPEAIMRVQGLFAVRSSDGTHRLIDPAVVCQVIVEPPPMKTE